jgi:hypothetical protein
VNGGFQRGLKPLGSLTSLAPPINERAAGLREKAGSRLSRILNLATRMEVMRTLTAFPCASAHAKGWQYLKAVTNAHSLPIQAGAGKTMGQEDAFHLAEYAALRQELVAHQARLNNAILFSLTSNAAVIAWLTSGTAKEIGPLVQFGSCIPFLITAIGITFYIHSSRDVRRIAGYCKILEQNFGRQGLGWETYLNVMAGKERPRFRTRYLTYPIFFLQLILSIAIALVMNLKPHLG